MTTWLPVVGYEAYYEVSSDGQVRSTRRKGARGGLLKPILHSQGYLCVNLCANGTCKVAFIHRVVAATFHGPRPDGYEVRHLDGRKTNNDVSNLKYGTSSENNYDQVRHGTNSQAAQTHCKHGHEFTPENTKRSSRGGRDCRTCQRRSQREYDARRRAKRAAA